MRSERKPSDDRKRSLAALTEGAVAHLVHLRETNDREIVAESLDTALFDSGRFVGERAVGLEGEQH